MTGLAIALLEVLACLGYGAVVLHAAGVANRLVPAERLVFAFALGLGVVGWLVFFLGVAGLLQPGWLAAVLGAGAVGAISLHGTRIDPAGMRRPGLVGGLILGAFAVAMVFDLAEGLSPPADADTLAYHFADAKDWLAAGHLVFVPRAVDGAVPLLIQAGYVPALGLGGEKALTLWAMLSGWAAVAMTYVVGRRFLPPAWAAAVALVFMTLPAEVYAGGSGQVEPRLALMATLALVATADARASGKRGFAVIAGLAVGFYIGAKYLGLLFAVPCGLVLLLQRRWFSHGLVFGLAVLAAGFQWYWWNWINAGDPVFPMLFDLLGSPYWSPEQAATFRQAYLDVESPLPRTVWWFLYYPIYATIGGNETIEATRTGLGPYLLLLPPFVAMGIWRARRHIASHPLATAALVALGFYVLWFFIGPSQRVRHLLPLMPVGLIAATVAARHWARDARHVAVAVAVTVPLQLGVHGLFSMSYLRHVLGGEDNEAFHLRTVLHYPPVPWINAHLNSSDRVLLLDRQLVYLIDVPTFFAPNGSQVEVGTGENDRDPAVFLGQIRRQRISHILSPQDENSRGGLSYLTRALIDAGCATVQKSFESEEFQSRTLRPASSKSGLMLLVRLNADSCGGDR